MILFFRVSLAAEYFASAERPFRQAEIIFAIEAISRILDIVIPDIVWYKMTSSRGLAPRLSSTGIDHSHILVPLPCIEYAQYMTETSPAERQQIIWGNCTIKDTVEQEYVFFVQCPHIERPSSTCSESVVTYEALYCAGAIRRSCTRDW